MYIKIRQFLINPKTDPVAKSFNNADKNYIEARAVELIMRGDLKMAFHLLLRLAGKTSIKEQLNELNYCKGKGLSYLTENPVYTLLLSIDKDYLRKRAIDYLYDGSLIGAINLILWELNREGKSNSKSNNKRTGA